MTFVITSASMLDEAKRWFEASTVICRFVPGGKDRAEKVCCATPYRFSYGTAEPQISESYTHLLARYGTGSK